MAELDVIRLPLRSMLPNFTLQTTSGREFSTWSLKGSKNMVILVFGKVCEPECRDLLTGIASEYKRFKEENAEVLAIFRTIREYADEIRQELNLPFPVLIDVEGMVAPKLAYAPPAVIITDRYGEVVAESHGQNALKIRPEQILGRVELNELECPE